MANQQYRFSNGTVPNNACSDPGLILRLPVGYKYVNGSLVKAYDQFDTLIEDNKLPNGGNSMSTLPTGQTFNRVGAIALGTERGNITAMNRAKNPNIVPYLNSLQNEINNLNSLLNSGKLDPQTRKKISNELKRLLKMVNNIKVPLYSDPNPNLQVAAQPCPFPGTFPPTKLGPPPYSYDGYNGFAYDIVHGLDNVKSPFYSETQGKKKGKFIMYPNAERPTSMLFYSWWDGTKAVKVMFQLECCPPLLPQASSWPRGGLGVGSCAGCDKPSAARRYYEGHNVDTGERVPGYLTMEQAEAPCIPINPSRLNFYSSCKESTPKFKTCFSVA